MLQKNKNRFKMVDGFNLPDVRVIKNPSDTNEAFVLKHPTKAKVSTHDKNCEIPDLIAAGKGDAMITENVEAVLYTKNIRSSMQRSWISL